MHLPKETQHVIGRAETEPKSLQARPSPFPYILLPPNYQGSVAPFSFEQVDSGTSKRWGSLRLLGSRGHREISGLLTFF